MDNQTRLSIDPRSGYCRATGIYHSKRKPATLPDDPFLSLPVFLLQSRDHDHRTAYLEASSGRSITYEELRRSVWSIAAGLAGFGVRQGDVVFLLLPNSIDFVAIFLGVSLVGAVVNATNPLYTRAEIASQLKDCGAKFAWTLPALVEKLTGFGLSLILTGKEEEISSVASSWPAPCSSLSKLLDSDAARLPIIRIRQEDPVALVYSSGTTGKSKGVIITHKNLIALTAIRSSLSAGESWLDRTYLCFIPMFHMYGIALFGCGLVWKRCTTVIMSKFGMEEMLALVERFKVTHIPLVPPVLVALAKSSIADKYDISSLGQVSCGGAPASEAAIVAFKERFPNVTIQQAYGLTETSGGVVMLLTEEEYGHYRSCGLLLPNIEAKIIDTNSGESLPPNKRGEIWLRGPTIMQGYFGNPKETIATIDKEGWIHTGDLCYFDEEGFLYIVDRLKEMIKYKGFQVAPAELEAVLLSHAEIVDAAVIPFPNEEAGQIPAAYVVKSPRSMLREVDVINYVAKQVAGYKKIRSVIFVNDIPKSPSGKILRRILVLQATSKL